VSTGDILFGDIDGVCCIPQDAEADVFTKALEKARAESRVRKALEAGMSAAGAFAEFGIM
jgi:regulator of RNase E activity RraA